MPQTYTFGRTCVVFFGLLTIAYVTRNNGGKKIALKPFLVEQGTSVINEIYEVTFIQTTL